MLTPIILGIISLLVFVNIWHLDFLGVLPLAHEAIIRQISEGVLILTPENKIIKANSPAATFLESSKDDLRGKNIVDYFSLEKGNDGFLENDFHGQVKLANNEKALYDILAANIYEGQKKAVAKLIILRDITAFQKAKNALHESEKRYQFLAENIIDVIWVLDINEGKFLYISSSIEQLRGFTVEESLSQKVEETLTPDSVKKLERNIPARLEVFLQGKNKHYTDKLEQLCKDGTTVWIETTTRFVRNAENGRIEVYGVSRDITKRIAFEEHEKELAMLEERQRLTRDLHDAVSQTLFSARLTAEVLLENKETIEKDNLWKNVAHFSGLVKSALGEMRILLLELRPKNLENTGITTLFSHLIDASRGQVDAEISLDKDYSKRLPVEVKIAFYRITQEALNNAIKHAQSKKIAIQLVSNNEIAYINIKDDGCGFTDSAKRKGQLGLSIMKERATEIGAIFKIESYLEKGTSVSCTWSEKRSKVR